LIVTPLFLDVHETTGKRSIAV